MTYLLISQKRHWQNNTTVDKLNSSFLNNGVKKKCFKCNSVKLASEFYKHPRMADGRMGKCKSCAKKDVHEHTKILKNDPIWAFQERARCRIKQAKRRSLGLDVKDNSASRRWVKKHRNKRLAHHIARYALKTGEIKTRENCESCGVGGKLHMHHPDYSRPKMVVWLCPKCHGIVHRKPL